MSSKPWFIIRESDRRETGELNMSDSHISTSLNNTTDCSGCPKVLFGGALAVNSVTWKLGVRDSGGGWW